MLVFVRNEPTKAQRDAGNYAKAKVRWQGMTISIENPAGSVRRGVDGSGQPWETRMLYDYGYLRGTEGVDGDHVDCFVGPNLDAPMVYVVHARKFGDWSAYDEDKCMIGFDSEEDARLAFLHSYNDPRFLGPITTMPVDEFKAKVIATKERPAMVKSILLLKTHVSGYTKKDGTYVKPHEDKRALKHVGVTEKPNYWRILSDADDSGGLPGVKSAVLRLLRSGASRVDVLSVVNDLGYSESRLDLPLVEGSNGAGIDLNIDTGGLNQNQSPSVSLGSRNRADSAAVGGKGGGVKTPRTVNNDSNAPTIGMVGHDGSRPRSPEVRQSTKNRESIDSYASPSKWAAVMYEKRVVPDGWYVHGRAYRQDLDTGWAIQQTKDWEVAEQYGGSGSLWLIRPKSDAKVLDLSDENSSDMDKVVDAALKDFRNNTGPIQDIINDIESSLGHYPDEDEFEEAIRSSFAPEDIVNSAEAYDNWGWAGWLAQEMEVDFVHVPEGAVALGLDGIQAVKVPNDADKALTKSMPRQLLIIKSAPESKASLIKEHKRLVAVLRSSSHEDDMKEADKQEDELEEYMGKAITRGRADSALTYRLRMIDAQLGPLAVAANHDSESRARYEALVQERYTIMVALGEASI